MADAFQSNAFQNDAFQIDAAPSGNYTITALGGVYTLSGSNAGIEVSNQVIDTHDGFWAREYRKMWERKPKKEEIIEALEESPEEVIQALPEVKEKVIQEYGRIDYQNVLNNAKLQEFIVTQVLIALQSRQQDEEDAEILLLMD